MLRPPLRKFRSYFPIYSYSTVDGRHTPVLATQERMIVASDAVLLVVPMVRYCFPSVSPPHVVGGPEIGGSPERIPFIMFTPLPLHFMDRNVPPLVAVLVAGVRLDRTGRLKQSLIPLPG